MKKRVFAAFLLLLTVVILAGCTGGSIGEVGPSPLPSGVTPSPLPTVNATTEPVDLLISHAEAEALVGNPLKQGADYSMPSNADGMSHVFYAPQTEGDRFLQVTLHQRTAEGMAVPKDIYDRLKRNSTPVVVDGDPVVVEGVGDEAFIAPPGLHMMAQGYYVIIAVGDPADKKNIEILKKAGQLVASKLQQIAGK